MTTLQEWPEPVVRVQAISESGVVMIPNYYIKPVSERPSTDQTLTNPHIPIVDLTGLFSGSSTACNDVIQAVSSACRNWGFFQIINHGVSLDLVKKVKDAWREFFHLPMEVKQVYANSPLTYEGYGSRLGVEKGAILDWGDYFFLNLFPGHSKTTDKWPTHPISCKEMTEEYGREVVKLCGMLMKVLSLGLGLEVELLQKEFGGSEESGACLRVNYYPKCPQPDLTLGLSAHSDPGGLTVLLADERVKGLQVRKDGKWIAIRPISGAFIVNVGDQIQVLSNGIFKSVEHRVLVNSTQDRLSLALFFNPRNDVPLGPLPLLVSQERPALYQPMTYQEYRMHIRKKGPRGKKLVESLKAM